MDKTLELGKKALTMYAKLATSGQPIPPWLDEVMDALEKGEQEGAAAITKYAAEIEKPGD